MEGRESRHGTMFAVRQLSSRDAREDYWIGRARRGVWRTRETVPGADNVRLLRMGPSAALYLLFMGLQRWRECVTGRVLLLEA
jgi:hypothetical protein